VRALCVCVCVCVCVCARAPCVCACACARVRVCVRVCLCVHLWRNRRVQLTVRPRVGRVKLPLLLADHLGVLGVRPLSLAHPSTTPSDLSILVVVPFESLPCRKLASPHLHQDSAPRCPHLRRDLADSHPHRHLHKHCAHICARTGRTPPTPGGSPPPTSAPGLGVTPAHICPRIALTPPTSALGLGATPSYICGETGTRLGYPTHICAGLTRLREGVERLVVMCLCRPRSPTGTQSTPYSPVLTVPLTRQYAQYPSQELMR
jgi:hypothetical protein